MTRRTGSLRRFDHAGTTRSCLATRQDEGASETFRQPLRHCPCCPAVASWRTNCPAFAAGQPAGDASGIGAWCYCFISWKWYDPLLSRPSPTITCFPSLFMTVSSDLPTPNAAVPTPLTSWPSATSLPRSVLTVPVPIVESHMLVYEPSGLRSTWSVTFEPLVDVAQPRHLPARFWTSWADTYHAENTANSTAVNITIG